MKPVSRKGKMARLSLISSAIVLNAAVVGGPTDAVAQSPCGPTTTVSGGDTFFSIAQRCDTTVAALQQANPGVDARDLQIGMTLDVAAAPGEMRQVEQQAAQQPEAGAEGYTVQTGDTAAAIAVMFGITVDELLAANPDLDAAALRVGQVILPPGVPGGPGQPPGDRTTAVGVLTDEGVECQAMRAQDGQLYTLIGNLEDYDSGDAVQVEGTVPEVSFCRQGTTIDVDRIRGVG